jgi:hypothetical protein
MLGGSGGHGAGPEALAAETPAIVRIRLASITQAQGGAR